MQRGDAPVSSSSRPVVHPSEVQSVLIIEDDNIQFLFLKTVISRTLPGVTIDWAKSAEEAFRLLNGEYVEKTTHPYDLIVTDIFLDGPMTGFDIWRLCRELYPDIPIFVSSFLTREQLMNFVREDGEKPYYLQKPISAHDLQGYLADLTGLTW